VIAADDTVIVKEEVVEAGQLDRLSACLFDWHPEDMASEVVVVVGQLVMRRIVYSVILEMTFSSADQRRDAQEGEEKLRVTRECGLFSTCVVSETCMSR